MARRLRLAVVALAGLTPLGCQVPTIPGEAPAYDPTTLTGGVLFAWPVGSTVRVYVRDDLATSEPVLVDAVDRALAAWQGATRYGELRLVRVRDVRDANVVVRAAGSPPLVDEGACGGGIGDGAGFTILCAAGDSARTLPLIAGGGGRVKVAIMVELPAAGGALDPLVAHELGHALGITGHSAHEGDVMHASPTTTRPSARDERTLRYILHQPVDVRL